MPELVFLKLGGSLITDKTRPYTPRLDVLANLAGQIAAHQTSSPSLHLVLGHGSGSFGHTAARQYRTREGVHTPEGWRGFCEVWHQASTLNRYVMRALFEAGVPALAFAPSASVIASDGKITLWETTFIRMALSAGIVPVIYGDVVFDEVRSGTILSTEELFDFLALQLLPERILLAGLEEAVYADFPARRHKLGVLTRESFNGISQGVGQAEGTDVTGGMLSKVHQMLTLVHKVPNLTVQIFSGEESEKLHRALKGEHIGTIIQA